MDNKRIILATVLCFGILVGWQYFAEYMGWVQPAPVVSTETVTTQNQEVANNVQTSSSSTATFENNTPVYAPSEGKNITVSTPLYTAVFHSAGGVLQSLELKNYHATSEPTSPLFNLISEQAKSVAPMGILFNNQPSWNKGNWSVSANDINLGENQVSSLVFEGELDGVKIRRELTFDAKTYLIGEKVSLTAAEGKAYVANLGYTVAATPFSEESTYDPMRVSWNLEGSYDEEVDQATLVEEGLVENGMLYWAALTNNYFLSAVAPANTHGVLKARIQNGVWRVAYESPALSLNGGQTVSQDLSWWFGPKDAELLALAPNELSKSVNFGFFEVLAKPLVFALEFIYKFVNNWGVAIIILTIIIKMIFWPLTKKSYKSMEQMKRIAPLVEELKKKHADNKEAMSREMMQLYKTYNVNPMSGCLPILVQLPVFIALYNALLYSNNLRHAEFINFLPFTDILWLADLSVKDPLYITPLLMGATMFIQQWLSPSMGDPTQRKVMMLMPVIFTVMFLNFPSGLVLYWLVNNILSIMQQWWTLRKV